MIIFYIHVNTVVWCQSGDLGTAMWENENTMRVDGKRVLNDFNTHSLSIDGAKKSINRNKMLGCHLKESNKE